MTFEFCLRLSSCSRDTKPSIWVWSRKKRRFFGSPTSEDMDQLVRLLSTIGPINVSYMASLLSIERSMCSGYADMKADQDIRWPPMFSKRYSWRGSYIWTLIFKLFKSLSSYPCLEINWHLNHYNLVIAGVWVYCFLHQRETETELCRLCIMKEKPREAWDRELLWVRFVVRLGDIGCCITSDNFTLSEPVSRTNCCQTVRMQSPIFRAKRSAFKFGKCTLAADYLFGCLGSWF